MTDIEHRFRNAPTLTLHKDTRRYYLDVGFAIGVASGSMITLLIFLLVRSFIL